MRAPSPSTSLNASRITLAPPELFHPKTRERPEAEARLKDSSNPNADPTMESLRGYLANCLSGKTPSNSGDAPLSLSPQYGLYRVANS